MSTMSNLSNQQETAIEMKRDKYLRNKELECGFACLDIHNVQPSAAYPEKPAKTSHFSRVDIGHDIYTVSNVQPSCVERVLEVVRGRFVGAPSGNRQRLRCPFEANHKHGDRTPSASVNLKTGWIDCYVCGSHSPQEILQLFGGAGGAGASKVVVRGAEYAQKQNAAPEARTAAKTGAPSLREALDAPLRTSPWRGLSTLTLATYQVRQMPNGWIALPYFTYVEGDGDADGVPLPASGDCVAVKYRLPSGQLRYVSAPGSSFTVTFGLQACAPRDKWFLAVVEGEVNAMSCWQAAGWLFDCVSIGSQQPKQELLRHLREFSRNYAAVLLWVDEPERARSIASVVRADSVIITSTLDLDVGGKPDANQILQQLGEDKLAAVLLRRVLPSSVEPMPVGYYLEQIARAHGVEAAVRYGYDAEKVATLKGGCYEV